MGYWDPEDGQYYEDPLEDYPYDDFEEDPYYYDEEEDLEDELEDNFYDGDGQA